ncbi:hypothetical protein TYRP_010793 [Tyrophagus putrescentiae]|nr:hypothetical protein TYRP_010793 [Tyrophagus putrescentiae]
MENPVNQSGGGGSASPQWLRYFQRRVDEFRHWVDQFEMNGPATNATDGSSHDDFNLISNLEAYLIEFQSLLIWENPFNSALALSAFTLPTAEVRENWTSVNPNVLSAPEILSEWSKLKELLALLVAEIVDLRQRSHGTFSFLTITVLAVIYYIGKCIPGVILLYSFALVILLTPGFLLHVLPRSVLDEVINYCNSQLFPSHKASSDVVIPNCESSDLCKEEALKSALDATAAASREGSVSRHSSASDLSDDFEIIDAAEIELK